MGNDIQTKKINTSQWSHIKDNLYQANIGGYQAQLYKITVPQKDVNIYLDSYAKRQFQTSHYVKIIKFFHDQDGCIIINYAFTIFTQRIHRLPTLILSFHEAIYLLKQLLLILKIQFYKYGLFKISPNMIGVNIQGKVRFWRSENFAETICSSMQSIKISELPNLLSSIIQMVNIQTNEKILGQLLLVNNNSITIDNLINKLQNISLQSTFKINKIFLNRNQYSLKYNQHLKQSRNIINQNYLNQNNLSRIITVKPISNPNQYKVSRIVYTSPKQNIQSTFINSNHGSFIKSSQIASNQKDSGNQLKFPKITDQQRYNFTPKNQINQAKNHKEFLQSLSTERIVNSSNNYENYNKANKEIKFKEYLQQNEHKIPQTDSQLIIYPDEIKICEKKQVKKMQRSLSDSDILKQLLEI